jgi:hypothetical protein
MSVPYRGSARAGPGAPPRYPRCSRLTVLTASTAFRTIQDALGCAVNGDSVSLAPTGSTPYPGFGTVGHNVTISAQSGATARTVAVDETTAALTVDAGKLADGPGGHNLIGNIGTGTGTGACSGLTNGVNGDQASVPAGLLPLANNGGQTNTAALAPTSPAIGAGNPTTYAQAPISGKDQRGHSRNATTRGGCDIGA